MIKIISFGKTKDKHLQSLIEDYLKRLEKFSFARTKLVDWKDDSLDNEMKKVEQYLEEKINSGTEERIFLLDELGEDYTTKEFKKRIQKVFDEGSNYTFIIGGAEGFPNLWKKELKEMYNNFSLIKLSSLTLTHEMAKLILVEQIYRVANIESGTPYHKE